MHLEQLKKKSKKTVIDNGSGAKHNLEKNNIFDTK